MGGSAIREQLERRGFARIPRLLDPAECRALAALYDEDDRFRKTVSMERHRFGAGEYRYFARPLPHLVETLRREFYRRLAPIANDWSERVGSDERYEKSLRAFLARCALEGQSRPTPLLLRYGADGFNCLHQDLYGPIAFPLQLTVQLGRPGRDFTGGEFLLVEQRPRQQSRGASVSLEQGEAIVFPTRERPVEGTRGTYRAQLRHGVSVVLEGSRTTLGIIFHDAR
jgi:hypothetical protein